MLVHINAMCKQISYKCMNTWSENEANKILESYRKLTF